MSRLPCTAIPAAPYTQERSRRKETRDLRNLKAAGVWAGVPSRSSTETPRGPQIRPGAQGRWLRMSPGPPGWDRSRSQRVQGRAGMLRRRPGSAQALGG